MLNIVIPMAGKGSRFSKEGYVLPKPLIDVKGKTMIERVINNLKPNQAHKFIFVCQESHLKEYNLETIIANCTDNYEIVAINTITDGAARTVLMSKKYINNCNELMIANCDQYVDININDYLKEIKGKDGLIMTMPANDPKWSFIKYDESKRVTLVREKEVISNEATVGIYNFSKGSDFVYFAEQMIKKNIKVNNEFYVAPVYNEMIENNMNIGFYDIGQSMYGLGTPADLKDFLLNFKKDI